MRFNTQLFVDLGRLQNNIQELRSQYPNKKILFMVKADAYGHGIIPCSQAAIEAQVCSLGVASLKEGIYIREQLKDFKTDIYVFSDTHLEGPGFEDYYRDFRIIPVLFNMNQLDFFLANQAFKNCELVLHFDTGMNRLGLQLGHLEEVISKVKNSGRKHIDHLTSHYSDAVLSKDSKKNLMQIERFERIKTEFKQAGIKLDRISQSNSGALEQKMESEDNNFIRPGLMLYGPKSLRYENDKAFDWQDKIISKLESRVIHSFDVKQGDPVGYGSTPCPRHGQMLIVGMGYGDGIPTSMMGKKILLSEQLGTIIGRVNMDMIQVLLDDQSVKMKADERVVIWDHRSSGIEFMCKSSRRIPYEVFCSLTSRIARKYCKI